jgi:hypothetical protein
MTTITISVNRPAGKITESPLYRATRSIRMNFTELAVLPLDENKMMVEFKSRSKDRVWDAYHDFRQNYHSKIFNLVVKTPKSEKELFSR